MNFNTIKIANNFPDEINVIIEISQNSLPVKYELDKEINLFRVNRFLNTAMHYPANYGFVPNTKSGDGDPLDVLVISRFPIITGAIIQAKPIGVLVTRDEAGSDMKILSTPIDKVDIYYSEINNYSDLPKITLNAIKHFFSHYKSLEENKYVSVGEWQDHKSAKKIIFESLIKQEA